MSQGEYRYALATSGNIRLSVMHARAALLFILVSAAASGCGGRERASAQGVDDGAPTQVAVARAERVPIIDTITVSGTLAAEEQVMLSLKVTGRIEELLVDLGTPVRRGQIIARLTPTDFELRRQQAEAALQQARARLGLPVEGEDDHVEAEQTGLVRSAQATLVAMAVIASPARGDSLPAPIAEGGGASTSCGSVNRGALFGALKLPPKPG